MDMIGLNMLMRSLSYEFSSGDFYPFQVKRAVSFLMVYKIGL